MAFCNRDENVEFTSWHKISADLSPSAAWAELTLPNWSSKPVVSSANGGNAKQIRVSADKTGIKRTTLSLAGKTPNKVINVLMANRETLRAFGSAYWTAKCDAKSTANTCFSGSGCESNSGIQSRQMCIDGIPETVIGRSSLGYPWR